MQHINVCVFGTFYIIWQHLYLTQVSFCLTADIQTCSAATEEEGLYDGLDWLQCQVTGNDVKETVMAPVKDSVIPQLSRLRNSLTSIRNYLWPSPMETSS